MPSFWEMEFTSTNIFSAYASLAASMMLFRSLVNDIFPEPVRSFFHSMFEQFVKKFFPKSLGQMTIMVDEEVGFLTNEIYDAAEVYLRTKINLNSDRLKVNKTRKQQNINLRMAKDQEVIDIFKGIRLKWELVVIEPKREQDRGSEKTYFEITFEKRHRETVMNEYLPFVLTKAKEIKDSEKTVKIYTRACYGMDDEDCGRGGGDWGCINFDHPVTFDKLAMDPNLKQAVIDDLDRFLRRKDYYRKVGKAWKRGYLLYGPPGTGKSSLIAAMANYLKFDVYDLELTSLYSNQELRRILLYTTSRSIIVIEDIDCSSQMHDREMEHSGSSDNTKLTLSGLLNFIDGLWSICGDERIIIFTTNHKDRLDPALLRPGRMDMHIHMGYCTPAGFDVLALNYLGIHDHHRLLPEIKRLIGEVEITPAEIAEHLLRSDDVDLALEGVIDLLKQKKEEKNEKNKETSDEKHETPEKQSDVKENGSDEVESKKDI
ncbi:AAA-ATPase [Sesamum alatum]|uniref:AAA-ATPase n=1 Tax=Sesamum alatum TaxID=300844 RepID=A0AAE2CCV3_9LAMI|nr:AAA-ATPase [Sesamum alatum]